MGVLSSLLGNENPLAKWANENSNWLGAVGAGIGNGLDTSQLGQGKQLDYIAKQQREAEALVTAQKNQSLSYMEQHAPEIAAMVKAGMPMSEGWTMTMQKMQPKAKKPPIEINGQLVDPDTYQVLGDFRTPDKTAVGADLKQQLLAGQKDVATDTILTAAGKARKLGTGFNVGSGGALFGVNPETDAAELRRQVAVLKSKATIENLSAMRQASPTGGALGAVSDSENAMLASAAGAIDPNASEAQFQEALDNYERTLLQIIHGPAAGQQIFEQTRNGQAYVPMSAAPAGNNGTTSGGVPWSVE